jgi:hypothetical protein
MGGKSERLADLIKELLILNRGRVFLRCIP